jgi:gelsolin
MNIYIRDEYGTAAYKTVELDELLAGVPVQHREVQGHESAAFRALFPVLSILSGGVESGFNHVKPETFQPRLLHIRKTGKTLAVMQVELKTASLNSGDVFLIDLGKLILQWNGSGSAPGERSSAATIARALDAERKGLATVRVVEETDDDAEVWAALGGKGPIAPAEAPVAAAPHEKRLLRVSDASGKLEISEVARGAAVKRDLCKSEDVFILDLGHEVYAWVGSKTSAQEKAKGLDFAAEFLKKEGRPAHTAIAKIFEGNEPEVFEAALH